MKLSENSATLTFMVTSAFKELFAPRMLVVEHSFADGFYCHEAEWQAITEEEIGQLEQFLREWLWSNEAIQFEYWTKNKVMQELERINSYSKLSNVKHWVAEKIPIVRFNGYFDYIIEPMSTDKTALQNFRLMPYDCGFIMRVPTIAQPERLEPFVDRPKLFAIIKEQEEWGSILDVSTIWQLNDMIVSGEIREMLWVAEGLHEKKIGQIADGLVAQFPQKRVVAIAGPSSSGKTTFAKRLGIQLKVAGYTTKQISMDDYFIDRDRLPFDENGRQDFEAIGAMDVQLLCQRLDLLLQGESIPKRRYNFGTGTGADLAETIWLDKRDFIIIEGIHGLNPQLSGCLGEDRIQKIYISALTQLNLDANHRVSTSDNRLVRRMVRDHKFRGYTPQQTLERWPSVRMGEEKNIFPFQEEADFMFNSALVYELSVLANYVLPLLKEDMSNGELATEALRLNRLLGFFEPLDEKHVPGISLLREFIGSSDLHY